MIFWIVVAFLLFAVQPAWPSWVIIVLGALAVAGCIIPPAGTTTPIILPDSALLTIRLIVGPIPAVILAAGILLVYLFPITKEQHEETLAELARRKATG